MFEQIKAFFTLKTIRGQIALGFIFLSLFFSFLFIAFEVYFHYAFIKRYEYMIHNTVPSRYYCSVAENCIGKSMSALDNYLLTQSDYYKEDRKEIWEVTYKSALDSLVIYTKDWQDNAATSLIYDIRIKGNRLKAEQDKIEQKNGEMNEAGANDADKADFSSRSRKDQIERLNMLVNDINSVLDLLINIQQEEINRTESQIRYDEDNLIYFISPFLLLIVGIIAYFIAYKITVNILFRIRTLRDAVVQIEIGNLPQPIISRQDELKNISEKINDLVSHLRKTKEFADEVGEGNLGSNFNAFSKDGEIGKAFLQMRESLKSVAEKDRKSNWVVQGISHFVEIMRDKNKDLKQISELFIVELVKYMKAVQGGIYIANFETEPVVLELTAFYAYGVLKQKKKIIEIGEGTLGEAFQEKRLIMLNELPQNYLSVSSGLGDAQANCVAIAPILTNGYIVGVIELASFKPFEEYEIEFLRKIAENFATEIISAQTNSKTKLLLEEAQRNAEQLRTQEEEMRQNVEELQATQEEMVRKETEINRMLQEAQSRESVMKKYTQTFNTTKDDLVNKTKELQELKLTFEAEKASLLAQIEDLKTK